MNSETEHEYTLDYVLSLVLNTGLILAFIIVLIGSAFFLWQHAADTVDYRIFKGEPVSLAGISDILDGAFSNALMLIQLGIIILIATPLIRVVSCLVIFAAERDYLYVALSGMVLGVLLFSFF